MNVEKLLKTTASVIRTRRAIDYRQCCAIARIALERTPGLSDSDWKAETREMAAMQGYDEPPPDLLAHAMSAVERAFAKTHGPRPLALPSVTSPARQATGNEQPSARQAHDCLQGLKHQLTAHGLPTHGLDRVLATPQDTTNHTAEQVAAWRQGQGRTPTHRRTARGWVPITAEETTHG